MYGTVLLLHSALRYVILVMVLLIMYRAAMGLRAGRSFEPADRKLSAAYMGIVHTHVVLGVLLFAVFSPITQAAFSQMGLAMKDKLLRFWTVEHTLMGVLVAALVTVGHIRAKRATGAAAHKQLLIMNGIALLVMFAMIPWPFRKVIGRAFLPV
jgi:hypothetical protein